MNMGTGETVAPIGHNGAPFDCLGFIDAILESSGTTYEKLIAIAIARHVGSKDSKPAYPSRARLMKLASCSLASFKRAQPVVGEFYVANGRDGKSTEYSPKALITASEIETAISALRVQTRYPTEPGSRKTGAPTEPGPGATRYLTDAGSHSTQALTEPQPGISQIPQKESLKEEEEKEERTVPDGTGGSPPDTSLRELVWTKCISWLLPRSCLDENRLRIRVGRWVQEFGAGAVIDAVAVAQKEAPVSIMAYVEGVLRKRARQAEIAAKADDPSVKYRKFYDGVL
jgi:hypothetical protein